MNEVSKCKTCGELDTIYHTSDRGYCTECYAIEDYEYVMVDDNGNITNPQKTGEKCEQV